MFVNNAPPISPLSPWVWPSKPRQRLHIDFAGHLFGKMYFILIDAHSKWPEIWEMSSTSTYKTIEGLRHQLQEFNGTQDTDNWVYPGHNHLGSNATNSNSNTMEQSSNRRYPQRD